MGASDLNIRIAKIRGWMQGDKWFEDGSVLQNVWLKDGSIIWYTKTLPNWSGSLDLMHELIGELNGEEYEQYLTYLGVVAPSDISVDDFTLNYTALRALVEATAAQKAEAYCRTKERT